MSMFATWYLSPSFQIALALRAYVRKRWKADTPWLPLNALGLYCIKDWKYKMKKPISKREFKVSLKVDRRQLLGQLGQDRHGLDERLSKRRLQFYQSLSEGPSAIIMFASH